MWLYKGRKAKYKDASEILGYGWKMAKSPTRVVTTNKGCFRSRIHRPPTYPNRWSQKTPRKKCRKESNISMKKYHQRPTLGVKSGSKRWTPYVDWRNSHDWPVNRYDMIMNHEREPMNKDDSLLAEAVMLLLGCSPTMLSS